MSTAAAQSHCICPLLLRSLTVDVQPKRSTTVILLKLSYVCSTNAALETLDLAEPAYLKSTRTTQEMASKAGSLIAFSIASQLAMRSICFADSQKDSDQ